MPNPSPATALPSPDSPCPCGSGQTYGQCCEAVIQQRRSAATAEQLMRSRYTAHVIRDHAYLHRTYLPTARLPYVEEPDAADLVWTRLVIHSHETGPKPGTAFVDFSAYHRHEGAELAVHEKSEFQQVDGAWFYARAVRSGPAPVKSAHPKVGRNDPCPCGSAKKYKHCCLAA